MSGRNRLLSISGGRATVKMCNIYQIIKQEGFFHIAIQCSVVPSIIRHMYFRNVVRVGNCTGFGTGNIGPSMPGRKGVKGGKQPGR